MDIKIALETVVNGSDLSASDMGDVMRQIMTGNADDAQIGAFLVALRIKGESIDEIAAAVEVLRELATGVQVSGDYLVDIVGTGGDESNLFNVSTASTFVVAAAGGRVAKHGNRSITSNCGSADVLKSLEIEIDLIPEELTECINKMGICFMFAPNHHPAMKYVATARNELGKLRIKTIFNMLGPLLNPGNVDKQIVGVFSEEVQNIYSIIVKKKTCLGILNREDT